MNKQYDVIGVGIAAVDDLIYVSDYPPRDCKVPISGRTRQGGGPACTAIAAASVLGGHASYIALFGGDDLSEFIKNALRIRGVDISHIIYEPAHGPYHSIIVVDSSGHRNVFYDPSRYKAVGAQHIPDSLFQSASLIHVDHITDPSLYSVVEKAHNLGVSVSGDMEGQSESAKLMASLIDYLVVPKAWALWASNLHNPQEACACLASSGRAATVVTDGANGCYFTTNQSHDVKHISAFMVEAYDTNGCGDTFHGAFALAIARSLAVEDAIKFASAAAALKAKAAGGTRRGWDALPTLKEVFEFLHTNLKEPDISYLLNKLAVLT